MNYMKTITAAALLTASIAAPAFAQDISDVNGVGVAGSYAGPALHARHEREGRLQRFYRSYNQVGPGVIAPPLASEGYRSPDGLGFSGRDPSRVGGFNPNLNPPGS